MKDRIFPPFIRKIGIAAPASGAVRERVEEGIRYLESLGIECVTAPHLFSGSARSYLSAEDEERSADFNAFLLDPSIDAIQCVRGGYGSMRILDKINWERLAERDLPVIGFSDITALHLAMLSKNAGFPVVSQMTARFPEAAENPGTLRSMKRVCSLLKNENSNMEAIGIPLKILRAGIVSGRVIPANLSLLAALCGTEYLPDFSGAILILEDVGEKLRILDRHLTQLRLSGVLSSCAGVIFGQFTDCENAEECNDLFRSFLPYISGPVLTGLPFGHELPSMSFLAGETGSIQIDGIFRLSNPAGEKA